MSFVQSPCIDLQIERIISVSLLQKQKIDMTTTIYVYIDISRENSVSIYAMWNSWTLVLTIGIYIKSICSKTIHSVLIARFNVDVYATSKSNPPSFNNFPPAVASTTPFSERGQSAQPVNKFSLFHVDSPMNTI